MAAIDVVYEGAAVATTTSTGFTNISPGAGGTFTVANDAGYPVTGKFEVVLDRDLPNEEKILVNSRSGTTFTIGSRGYDDTTAQSHTAGTATVEHTLSSLTIMALVNHQNGVEVDPHSTTLLNNARHDIAARHTFGNAFPTPATPVTIVPDATGAAGAAAGPARADHTHGIVAAAASSITGTNAEGASTSFARADHNHVIAGTNHIPAAALVNKSVDTAQIVDAIIANGSTLLGSNQNLIVVTGTDPGAIGANRLWLNTTAAKRALLIRDGSNANWEVITSFGPGINYTPTLTNFSVGAGYNIARYRRVGRNIIADGFCKMGTGATTNGSPFAISLPVAAADNSASFPAQEFYYHAAARAFDASAAVNWAGVGVIGSGGTLPPAPGNNRTTLSFFATGGTAAWNNTIPFTWNGPDQDSFSWFCEYEANTAIDANFV